MNQTDEQRKKARKALDDVEGALDSMRDLREALVPTDARRRDLDRLIAEAEKNVEALRRAMRDAGIAPLQ